MLETVALSTFTVATLYYDSKEYTELTALHRSQERLLDTMLNDSQCYEHQLLSQASGLFEYHGSVELGASVPAS